MLHLTPQTAALLLLLTFLSLDVQAKEWRGITPLKSTRADVERLFGQENKLGRYQFEDERAYIFYSKGPCEGVNQTLQADKCECFVPKGTVLSIHVTLEIPRKFSKLRIDKTKYDRQLIRPGAPAFEYSNLKEGIVYRVDESNDEIIGINYLASAKDCQEVLMRKCLVGQYAPARGGILSTTALTQFQMQRWKCLGVLKSTRAEVERSLGPPTEGGGNQYRSEDAIVNVEYSTGPCSPGSIDGWNVPRDTVTGITAYPKSRQKRSDLKIDESKFTKVSDPHMPEEYLHLVDCEHGVTIVASGDVVKRFEYWPASRYKDLACRVVNKK